MSPAILVLVTALAAQSPSPATDSLYQMALRLPESRLVLEARARPLVLRETLGEAMTLAVRQPARTSEALEVLRRLAAGYAAAWQDSFLVRQVDRFRAYPAASRAAKVRADSLRRAGVAAFTRSGPAAAIALWRRALAAYRGLSDTAGMAGTLDNIGAGLVRLGRLDSAAVYLTRGSALAAGIGDLRVQANALGHLGDLSAEQGDLDRAGRSYGEARVLRERVGDSRGIAADHNNLGLLAQELGDAAEARRQFESALALHRKEGRHELAATNLVNLAGLAALEGDFALAVSQYKDALATWRQREEWAEAAVALYGLGQLELRRGDYPAARTVLSEALTLYERTGSPAEVVEVRAALANALAAAGNLQGALDLLEQTQRYADSARVAPGARAALALAQGDLLVRLNTLAEAERRYLRAQQLFRLAGDAAGEAEVLHGLGWLYLTRGSPARAQALLAPALRTQLATGNRRAAALTRLSLGQAARQRGDTVAARRHFVQAADDLQRLGDPVASAVALGERAELEAAAGAAGAAEVFYRSGLKRLEGRLAPETSWQLRAGLALALRVQGALDAAARELRAAAAAAEAPSRSLALPERRSAFWADKWDVFAQLALLEWRRGLPAAAFEASERLRAREMLELLGAGRIPTDAEEAPDLVGREQDLRRRISELTRELESGTGGPERLRGPDLTLAGSLTRDALLRAQEEYADLLLKLRERAPRHGAFVAPRIASGREISRRLAADQAFLTYLLSDSGSVAFLLTRDSIATVELGATRREIVRLVEFTRGALEGGGRRSDSLWRGPLQRLHGYLIAPLEEAGLLAGKTRLVVAPHAELHYLPFAALVPAGGGRFLGERFELTLTPSASVWLALGDRAPTPRGTGVLALAPRPEALPASRREVAAIGRLLPGVDIRIGAAATEELLRREAPHRSVLHLATYGVLNKQNPLFSFVELAAGAGQDGRLEVHEVFGLRLRADLVVLSACQTGLGSGALADVPAGDDWVGLTRAFLHAGAGRVVATLWPVDDWATAALMERFYEEQSRGASVAQALARAQRELQSQPATANPFFWAGFVLVGGADSPTRVGARAP